MQLLIMENNRYNLLAAAAHVGYAAAVIDRIWRGMGAW